jgi:hypothetical protein
MPAASRDFDTVECLKISNGVAYFVPDIIVFLYFMTHAVSENGISSGGKRLVVRSVHAYMFIWMHVKHALIIVPVTIRDCKYQLLLYSIDIMTPYITVDGTAEHS